MDHHCGHCKAVLTHLERTYQSPTLPDLYFCSNGCAMAALHKVKRKRKQDERKQGERGIGLLDEAGKKGDAGKARYDLIPPEALDLIVQTLTYGAEKYGAHNWVLVKDWRSRYFAACMRHLWAWWRGEELDPGSGLPHLAHAACCVLFMLGMKAEREALRAEGKGAADVHD